MFHSLEPLTFSHPNRVVVKLKREADIKNDRTSVQNYQSDSIGEQTLEQPAIIPYQLLFVEL